MTSELDELKQWVKNWAVPALKFYSDKNNFQYDMPIEFSNSPGEDAPALGTMAKEALRNKP